MVVGKRNFNLRLQGMPTSMTERDPMQLPFQNAYINRTEIDHLVHHYAVELNRLIDELEPLDYQELVRNYNYWKRKQEMA